MQQREIPYIEEIKDECPIAQNGLVFGFIDAEMMDILHDEHNWKGRAAVVEDMIELLKD